MNFSKNQKIIDIITISGFFFLFSLLMGATLFFSIFSVTRENNLSFVKSCVVIEPRVDCDLHAFSGTTVRKCKAIVLVLFSTHYNETRKVEQFTENSEYYNYLERDVKKCIIHKDKVYYFYKSDSTSGFIVPAIICGVLASLVFLSCVGFIVWRGRNNYYSKLYLRDCFKKDDDKLKLENDTLNHTTSSSGISLLDIVMFDQTTTNNSNKEMKNQQTNNEIVAISHLIANNNNNNNNNYNSVQNNNNNLLRHHQAGNSVTSIFESQSVSISFSTITNATMSNSIETISNTDTFNTIHQEDVII
ncbi:hypothetical protein ABK040_000251 [Willaertia magna]